MNLEVQLSDRLATAYASVAGHAVDPVVRRSQHADFQSDAALSLARELRRVPREVAAEVAARADLAGLAAVTVSGPGFLNLTVDDALIAAEVAGPIEIPRVAEPQTVVIDYSAPNVAKELQIGHLRSTIIGDAAARLLELLGHDVRRANHLGDWGTPFGMLVEHLLETRPGDDLTAFYQAARARFDADEDFRARARLRVVALQGGDEQTLTLWRQLVAESERHFLAIYDRLGVTLTPDDFVGESFYNDMLPSIVDDLSELGLLRVSEGALCAFPAGFTGRDGEPLPLIVRKSDGGFGYAATDLAAVRYRAGKLHADRMLYVVGSPQRNHFQMVWAVAREAGWLPPEVSVEHVGFGSILGADGKAFKSRAGETVKLADVLDEAVSRASALNADPSIAQAVGIGAIKYADLSGDRISDYTFDWDRMLALTGNTGPYFQYAHARIMSIFDRAQAEAEVVRQDGIEGPDSGLAYHFSGPVTLTEPRERMLALELLGFEAVLASVAESLEFHRLAGYLHGVAGAFSAFYESCPVLKAPPGVRESRLSLCARTAATLRQGLSLLGIETPDRL